MLKTISLTGALALIFNIVKWSYERFEKIKINKDERKKKLDFKALPFPQMFIIGLESNENSHMFNINGYNPKDYPVKLLEIKLYLKNSENVRVVYSQKISPFLIKEKSEFSFSHSFPPELLQKRNKQWFIRLIDDQDDLHDSNIIDFTSL